ncbi:MAG: hypothetical protein RBR87_12575 [Bacteroidales bacterium]|nr:hypothetical protein [Bacteroidales bacterium]
MKKVSSFIVGSFVLISLLLPFRLMQQLQRKQADARQDAMLVISQQMPDKSLIYLAIPHAEMQGQGSRFIRIHAREFVWDGMMYDIVERFEGETQTWFLVYPDHKETKVLNQKIALAKAFNQKDGVKTKNTTTQILWHWYSEDQQAFIDQLYPIKMLLNNYLESPYKFLVNWQPEHPPQLHCF